MTHRVNLRLVVGGGLLALVILSAVLAPWLATHDPRQAVTEQQLQAPSSAHYLGTDYLGRDVFSRVLYGGRRALTMALLAAAVTFAPGLVIGVLAGTAGRWLDAGLMAVMDALLAIPSLLMALALVALLGSGLGQVALAVGIAGIPAYARVTRAAVLEARIYPFVEAARGLGAGDWGVLRRHIVPNIAPTLFSFAGVTLSWAILNGAALVFLGYGGDITAPDWGVMLNDGRDVFRTAPWVSAAPGGALSLTVFAINLLTGSLGSRPIR